MYSPGEVGIEQAKDGDDDAEDNAYDGFGDGGSRNWVGF